MSCCQTFAHVQAILILREIVMAETARDVQQNSVSASIEHRQIHCLAILAVALASSNSFRENFSRDARELSDQNILFGITNSDAVVFYNIRYEEDLCTALLALRTRLLAGRVYTSSPIAGTSIRLS